MVGFEAYSTFNWTEAPEPRQNALAGRPFHYQIHLGGRVREQRQYDHVDAARVCPEIGIDRGLSRRHSLLAFATP